MERREHKIRHANIILGVAHGSLWLLIAMGIASLTSGCGALFGNGIEMRNGIYRVDGRDTTERTATVPTKPLKCYFSQCPELSEEVRGS